MDEVINVGMNRRNKTPEAVKATANGSLKGNKKSKHASESVARFIFLICAVVAILAVCSITIYMFIKGTESLKSVGIADLLFKTVWAPTATPPAYGIVYIILSSIAGTTLAILLGVPIGLLTAVFLTEIAGKKLAAVVQPAVELLAAIPSVIYGLLGLMLLNPLLYKLEKHVFANSTTHQYTGGANLLAAVLVLAIMILPTVINMSASAIRAVPMNLRATSLALGATKIQTIFKVVVPAAKSGIITGIVLGIGRALGEAMAINLVAGGSVNLPLPFNSVRFLTTQIVSEMYEGFAKENARAAGQANYQEGKAWNEKYYSDGHSDWTYYNSDYYYQCNDTNAALRESAWKMTEKWELGGIDCDEIEANSSLTLDGGFDFNSIWNSDFRNQVGRRNP